MLRCENFTGFLTATSSSEKLVLAARCKQWTCGFCAAKNRAIWQARIIDFINHSQLSWSWFTLTAHSKKRTASASLKNLRDAWEALIKRIKRHFPDVEKIHYVRVYEKHKNGAYHLHCIISVVWEDIRYRISKSGKKTAYSAWLAKTASDLKIGYYTHADNFDDQHAGYIAGYVVKYMTKQTPNSFGRVRHIVTSQGWPKLERDNEYEWQLQTEYTEIDFTHDISHGLKVIDLNDKHRITYDDFSNSMFYMSDLNTGEFERRQAEQQAIKKQAERNKKTES